MTTLLGDIHAVAGGMSTSEGLRQTGVRPTMVDDPILEMLEIKAWLGSQSSLMITRLVESLRSALVAGACCARSTLQYPDEPCVMTHKYLSACEPDGFWRFRAFSSAEMMQKIPTACKCPQMDNINSGLTASH